MNAGVKRRALHQRIGFVAGPLMAVSAIETRNDALRLVVTVTLAVLSFASLYVVPMVLR